MRKRVRVNATPQLPRAGNNGEASVSPGGMETLRIPCDLTDFITKSGIDYRVVNVPKGSYLYEQESCDDYIYLIVSGYIEVIALLDAGHETVIDILGFGALCGEGAAFDGMPRCTGARALVDATTIRLTARSIKSILGEHALLVSCLISTMSVKQRMLVERLTQVTQLSPEERVLRLLVQIGSNSDNSYVAISHEKLANLIGLTRVTVTRAIGKLCESGAITKRHGKIYLQQTLASYAVKADVSLAN